MEEDDYDIDNVLNNINKKKKKKSNIKGKAGERKLIEVLTKRFPGLAFSRTLGSGNRWSQARLTETAKKVFTGDIICPDEFVFALECKKGYNKIDVERAANRWKQGKSGNKQLDGFLEQAASDGEKIHKPPLLIWKKDYKPWMVFIKKENLTDFLRKIEDQIEYKGWISLPLDKVLLEKDDFFIK